MPIPDFQSLMLPLLTLATDAERRVPEVEDKLADMFSLTAEERQQMLGSGRQRLLLNRIHWAKFYLQKAGLLDAPGRGRFIATDEGRKLLASQPDRIDNRILLDYPSFREFYRGGTAVDTERDTALEVIVPENVATPEEQIDAAVASLQAALQSDLLARIQQNSPGFFERVIIDLLVAMGYGGSHRSAAEQLGRSGDGGVDGVINEDPLGLDRVYIQAKRYAAGNSVGRNDVQAFLGSLVGLGATKGVFVTTSTFTAQAKDFARHLPQRVILIDGQRLTDLMVEHNVGVRVSRQVEFKRLDEDFFTDEV